MRAHRWMNDAHLWKIGNLEYMKDEIDVQGASTSSYIHPYARATESTRGTPTHSADYHGKAFSCPDNFLKVISYDKYVSP